MRVVYHEVVGTGSLAGIADTGGYAARHEVKETPVTREYELPA